MSTVLLVMLWVFGRVPLATWAIRRSLDKAGLAPHSFVVQSLDLSGIGITKLSIGSAPYFAAENITATFSLSSLFHSRIRTLRLDGVVWNIESRGGTISWGPPLTGTSPPAPIDLPLDILELSRAMVRVDIDGTSRDFNLAGKITPQGNGVLALDLEVDGLGRHTSIDGRISSSAEQLNISLSGSIPQPAAVPLAQWTLHADYNRRDGSSIVDAQAMLNGVREQIGSAELKLASAAILAHAQVAGSALADLHATASLQHLDFAGHVVDTADIQIARQNENTFQVNCGGTGPGWNLPSLHGTVSRTADAALFAVAAAIEQPLSLDLKSLGLTASISALGGDAKIRFDDGMLHLVSGQLNLDGGTVQAGDLTLSDGHAAAVMAGTDSVEVISLGATIGDGSTVAFDRFTWNTGSSRLETRCEVRNLSLEHWLPVITSKRATGDGRVSGAVESSIDWTSGSLAIETLKGSLLADPVHGYIQVIDADALGDLLEKQDPRFATDEVMRPVRDKIIDALRDFAFNKLSVDLSRTGDQTVALTYLSGFGRHGVDPQGLNLTLDLHVQDAALNLAARLAAKSEVTKAAKDALEDFFQRPPQEKR